MRWGWGVISEELCCTSYKKSGRRGWMSVLRLVWIYRCGACVYERGSEKGSESIFVVWMARFYSDFQLIRGDLACLGNRFWVVLHCTLNILQSWK